jgi:peptidoglycan/xylan/chitin deacetylase (PgdA/CDA1 family)
MQRQFDGLMTSAWRLLRERTRILTSQLIATRTIAMRNQRAIISFTFDDFPRSAVTNGAEILHDYGLTGTFYAAGSLRGRTISDMVYYNTSDLPVLEAMGHEIGCHTLAHLPVSKLRSNLLDQEIDGNASLIAESVPGIILRNFSYPFGSVAPFQKLCLQRRFASCRSTQWGLNFRRTDLWLLKSIPLYQKLAPDEIAALVEQAVERRAWLIFYTHDVDKMPSPYGCTPELFEYAVRTAAASKADVLDVRKAVEAVQYGSDGLA